MISIANAIRRLESARLTAKQVGQLVEIVRQTELQAWPLALEIQTVMEKK